MQHLRSLTGAVAVLIIAMQPVRADQPELAKPLTPTQGVAAVGLEDREVAAGDTVISEEVATVAFEVERVFVPIGPQPPGTDLPIGLVAKPIEEDSVAFSVLLMGELPKTFRRVGIVLPEQHFAGRHVEVRGKVRKYPPGPGRKGAGPTYQIWVESLVNFQVRQ